MLACPRCRAAYEDGTRVCPADGASLVGSDNETLPAPLAATQGGPTRLAPAADGARLAASPSQAGHAAAGLAQTASAAAALAPTGGGARGVGPGGDTLIGALVADRYQVLRKIGEGGMGAVYEARHNIIAKRVAVKVLLEKFREKSDLVARLLQEARLASSIGHENIVDVTDFGTTADGRSFVVMELLDGESLAQLAMREAPLPVERTLRIGRQVAGALTAAHAKGVLHRDVKPENVFLVRRGEADFVKVVDFGISKAVRLDGDDAESARLTHTGMVLGTPLYMSPEQARGDDSLDERADIWAVGVLLYECLTGEVPFRASNYLGIISQILTHNPAPPSALRPELGIPPAVEGVVMRAMHKDRASRYQKMADLENDLGRLLAGEQNIGVNAAPAASAPPARAWPLLAGAALALGVGFGAWAMLRPPAGAPPHAGAPLARPPAAPLAPLPRPATARSGSVASPALGPGSRAAPRQATEPTPGSQRGRLVRHQDPARPGALRPSTPAPVPSPAAPAGDPNKGEAITPEVAFPAHGGTPGSKK